MQKEFSALLDQINYPEENRAEFSSTQIDRVDLYKEKRQIHFSFSFDDPIKPDALLLFVQLFEAEFTRLSAFKYADFSIEYRNQATITDTVIKGYFPYVLEYLSKADPLIRALNSYDLAVESRRLSLFVPTNEDVAEIEAQYAQGIKDTYEMLGFLIDGFYPVQSNMAKSDEQLMQEKLASLPEISPVVQRSPGEEPPASTSAPAAKKPRRNFSRKDPVIHEDSFGPEPIADPTPCHMVNPPLEVEMDVVMEGYMFDAELREIKTRDGRHFTIFEGKFTDYTDSMYVSMFIRNDAMKAHVMHVLGKGNWVRIAGKAKHDDYKKEVALSITSAKKIEGKATEARVDTAEVKRVELHLHTKMSTMDGVTDIEDYVKQAKAWGHEAIALTDHGVLQAIPEAYAAAKKHDMKPIYGLEGYLVDDQPLLAWNEVDTPLMTATFVIYDVETTGFSTNDDDVIEIAAVKVRGGAIIDEFSSYINANRTLSDFTTKLTGITQADVDGAPEAATVFKDFHEWIEGCILVAHNADFDMGHLAANFAKLDLPEPTHPVMDTLALARTMYHADHGVYWHYATDETIDEKAKRKMKQFNLKALARFFSVELTQHHRAIYDARATGEAFVSMLADLAKLNIKKHDEVNSLTEGSAAYKMTIPTHLTLLATSDVGLKNLFKIASQSMTKDLAGVPRIRRGFLEAHREDILIGSGCVNGEVWQTAMDKPYAELLEKIDFYDFLEVQPPEVYGHLIDLNGPQMKAAIQRTIERILAAGREKGKLVVATGDVHHLERGDTIFRQIYTRTPAVGGGRHPLDRPAIKKLPSMHFRTTDEMLEDFAFLGEDVAYELVVTNSNIIANKCEKVQPIKKDLFTPADDFMKDQGIPSIATKMREMCEERAVELYGNPLPEIVRKRLDRELDGIIGNNFAVIYYISHLLVKKSLDDGYLVGSRGSVGSSFVATLMDITEVNPLSPHYYCSGCQFSTFKMNEDEKKLYGLREDEQELQADLELAESGFDLPNRECPSCGATLNKEGHDIPFETFLGFKGDKVPDIDLNFSGEYQSRAHLYCRELFGEDYAFRAGTITTVAEKTAFGFVKGYFDDENKSIRNAEVERLVKGCVGVRRSSGQHPGGIIVVPDDMDIYDFTPIQYPADDVNSEWETTHFEFKALEDNLLKLDILGHDDPTMIRTLQDLSGIDQTEIPVDCPEVYALFSSTKSLGVTADDIKSQVGTYGVPEFGTFFVRNMLVEMRPKTFAELVKISGLSHGTDVWSNNAQDLVSNSHPEFKGVEFSEVIGCRDDIMVYLMYGGMDPADAFEIMEFVRRGLPSKVPDKWAEYVEKMKAAGIPDWYTWSCGQIKYMFPKAHATAYVLMAVRIAWFKVHKPLHYYAAYFSKRADLFDVESMVAGADAIANLIDSINAKGFEATPKEKSLITVLELALEMTRRGFSFKLPCLERSAARDFKLLEDEKALLLPFAAIDGLGDAVADKIVEEREVEAFKSVMDFKRRTKTNTTILEWLIGIEFFGDMEYGQLKAPKEVVVADGQGSLF